MELRLPLSGDGDRLNLTRLDLGEDIVSSVSFFTLRLLDAAIFPSDLLVNQVCLKDE